MTLASLAGPTARTSAADPGTITDFAGSDTTTAGYAGNGGQATSALLHFPISMAVDAAGNVYIADLANCVVRKVTGWGVISTVAGTGPGLSCGYTDDTGPTPVLATSAKLNVPAGVAVDTSGNLYIADTGNCLVRKVDAVTRNITTVAGNPTASGFPHCGYDGDGAATSHELSDMNGVAVDGSGNLYIADYSNCLVRKVSAGAMATVAGVPNQCGYSGDGAASTVKLDLPASVAVDATGTNVYIADSNNCLARVMAGSTITTIAGSTTSVPNCGYMSDGVPALGAKLGFVQDVVPDAAGDVYIADYDNSRVRFVITPLLTSVHSPGTAPKVPRVIAALPPVRNSTAQPEWHSA